MKKLFLTAAMILGLSTVYAQGLYFNLNTGYASKMNGTGIGFLDFTNKDYSGFDPVFSEVNASFGKGINYNLNIGYQVNPHLGFELGLGRFMGGTIEANQLYKNGWTINYTAHASQWRVNPMLVLSGKEGKLTPYGKFGILLGSGKTFFTKDEITSSNRHNVESWELSGGLSKGFNAALGLKYGLSDKLSINAEIALIAMNYAPQSGKMVEYLINDNDNLSSLDTKDTQVIFDSKVDFSSQNQSKFDPTVTLKTWLPYSSMGLNIGISYKL